MYLVEHYMKTLKSYVRNKARPKGSMAKGYAIEEALRFYTTTKQRVWDDKEDPCMVDEVVEGNGCP